MKFQYLYELSEKYADEFRRLIEKSKQAPDRSSRESLSDQAYINFWALYHYREIVLNRSRWKAQRAYADLILSELCPSTYAGIMKSKKNLTAAKRRLSREENKRGAGGMLSISPGS